MRLASLAGSTAACLSAVPPAAGPRAGPGPAEVAPVALPAGRWVEGVAAIVRGRPSWSCSFVLVPAEGRQLQPCAFARSSQSHRSLSNTSGHSRRRRTGRPPAKGKDPSENCPGQGPPWCVLEPGRDRLARGCRLGRGADQRHAARARCGPPTRPTRQLWRRLLAARGQWPPERLCCREPGSLPVVRPDGAWALRVTHYGPRDRAVFSGILQTGGKFVDVHSFGQGNDIVAVARNQHAIVFRFVNYGWVDGLDFATTCSAGFTVSIDVNGQRASPGAIHLGSGGVSPASNPFRVQRGRGRAPQTTTTTTSTQPGGEPPTTSANPDHHHDRAPRWPGGPGT